MKTAAVLLGAGRGRRAGGPKQFRRVAGRTLLEHAADGLLELREIGGLVVVVPASEVEAVRKGFARTTWSRPISVVAGGATRHLSSRAGVAALPPEVERVLIHDAARPFASVRLIRRLLRALRDPAVAGVIPAVDVHDSTVLVEGRGGGHLKEYLPRERLRAVQTPQAFRAAALREAFARSRGRDFCDDAIVLRRRGLRVDVVEGERENRKITTADELESALRELRSRGASKARRRRSIPGESA